jgi:hypothetical protein
MHNQIPLIWKLILWKSLTQHLRKIVESQEVLASVSSVVYLDHCDIT